MPKFTLDEMKTGFVLSLDLGYHPLRPDYDIVKGMMPHMSDEDMDGYTIHCTDSSKKQSEKLREKLAAGEFVLVRKDIGHGMETILERADWED